jgi:hypothetical protein
MSHGEAPAGAVVLFNGRDMDGWVQRDGSPGAWAVEAGVATVARGGGDIVSTQKFRDQILHLEFRLPSMPDKTGQAKANSGVYLQGRYEIQVLDSSGWATPGTGDCGAIYNVHAPLVNACLAAGEWQSYLAIFRAARSDAAGGKVENARLTLWQNSEVIHNNVELPGVTGGAMDRDESSPGPLLLQDHGDPVQYRNIWVKPLPEKGSEEYGPR